MLASKSYPAVATASAAISASLGFEDGEKITRRTMLEVVHRISRAVAIPVTADMESGYGASVAELDETTRCLIETGAVGLNIEDSLEEGGPLRRAGEQAERIAAVRETAAARGLDLVVNARVDTFLSDMFDQREERIEEAVARAEVYRRAGADCIYPIGPGDAETLTVLRSRIMLPLNALARPDAAPATDGGLPLVLRAPRERLGTHQGSGCPRRLRTAATAAKCHRAPVDFHRVADQMPTGPSMSQRRAPHAASPLPRGCCRVPRWLPGRTRWSPRGGRDGHAGAHLDQVALRQQVQRGIEPMQAVVTAPRAAQTHNLHRAGGRLRILRVPPVRCDAGRRNRKRACQRAMLPHVGVAALTSVMRGRRHAA